MILTIKEVMVMLDCKETTAHNHMVQIRKMFKTTFVTKFHLARYLCIDIWALEASYQYRVKQDFEKANKILVFRESNQCIKKSHSFL